MKIPGNQFINQAISNLIPLKKDDTEKKSETIYSESQHHLDELQRMLAEEENYQKNMEADRIAKKIARGEHVTSAERQKLEGVDPERLIKAEQANMQRKAISAQLANATTKEQANAILLEGKRYASNIIENGEEEYGELLLEAVNKAEEDYNGRKKAQTDLAIGAKGAKVIGKESHSFDIRL